MDGYSEQNARSTTPQAARADQYHLGGSVGSNGAVSSGNGAVAAASLLARKKLASWVGFSNLPNQVHRKSVR
jgi:septin 7